MFLLSTYGGYHKAYVSISLAINTYSEASNVIFKYNTIFILLDSASYTLHFNLDISIFAQAECFLFRL